VQDELQSQQEVGVFLLTGFSKSLDVGTLSCDTDCGGDYA